MIEKFQGLSKVFFVIGVVLYFFGFISLNSFLSRFGMISFDVVNSRFVFAGFFSLLSVGLVVLVAWTMSKEIPMSELVNVSKNSLSKRFGLFWKFAFVIWTVNLMLYQVLTL